MQLLKMSVKAWKSGSGRFLSRIGLMWSGPGAFVFFRREIMVLTWSVVMSSVRCSSCRG
jgi:hypothetical protein